MGTEVLRPHDCLIDRIRGPPSTLIPHRRSFHNNNNNRYNKRNKPAPGRSDEKKKKRISASSPAISRRYSSDDLRQPKNHHNHKHNRTNERMDPKPRTAVAPNQVWIGNRSRSLSPKHVADVYAGSAISISPSPESLPLPSFSKNKRQIPAIVDDSASATRDLRRLLRLD